MSGQREALHARARLRLVPFGLALRELSADALPRGLVQPPGRSRAVLVCDLATLELTRLAPSEARAHEAAARLDAFVSVPTPTAAWVRAREVQLALASAGAHRGIPPADLLIAAAAESAGVELVHYDRDYERIAEVTALDARWLVRDGTLVRPTARRMSITFGAQREHEIGAVTRRARRPRRAPRACPRGPAARLRRRARSPRGRCPPASRSRAAPARDRPRLPTRA